MRVEEVVSCAGCSEERTARSTCLTVSGGTGVSYKVSSERCCSRGGGEALLGHDFFFRFMADSTSVLTGFSKAEHDALTSAPVT